RDKLVTGFRRVLFRSYLAPQGGPKPDFHSTDPRITDGFVNYPQPVKSWTGGPPGSGGTLNVFMAGYYPPPTPKDQNNTWKEVEKIGRASCRERGRVEV